MSIYEEQLNTTINYFQLGDYSQVEDAYFAQLDAMSKSERHGEKYDNLLSTLGDFFLQIGLFGAAR